ncbi:MAG: dihydroorotate dehydrogenase [Candidatus Diapherotrites archaeon]|nr:dihydroorotate dehydrogenase [Candidatus Diapherotrites archaeon]
MLETKIAEVRLRNPTVLASGILGTSAAILKRVASSGAGAVTMKSIGPEPRAGHNNPTVLSYGPGLINAVGLPTPGYKNMSEEWEQLADLEVPVIASIYGGSIDEFVEVARFVAGKKPAIIELNISCPNTKKHGQVFGFEPDVAGEVVSRVKGVTEEIPVMPKLSPNTPKLKEVAKACEDAGADAISAINTVGPGMVIDVNTAKPVLDFKTGGLSGPAIKPIAVRCVYDIYEVVDLPIVGIGGVSTGRDAAEMIMAGAVSVGIGSGVYYRGIDVFKKVCDELEGFMEERGYKTIKEMVGLAHE